MIEPELLRKILEGAILASTKPMTVKKLRGLFVRPDESSVEILDDEDDDDSDAEIEVAQSKGASDIPGRDEILAALKDIQLSCDARGFELVEVASGWRFQVRQDVAPWVNRMWDEKPQKYSRALLETLALIAYRQPITRGDIEEIRGVAVSSHIMKTLQERDWVKVVGHRDVPGRPSLFATTKVFLDYFNLSSLEQLPTLSELRDIDSLDKELEPELSLDGAAASQTGEEGAGEFGLTHVELTGQDEDETEPESEPGVKNDVASDSKDSKDSEGDEPESSHSDHTHLDSTDTDRHESEVNASGNDDVELRASRVSGDAVTGLESEAEQQAVESTADDFPDDDFPSDSFAPGDDEPDEDVTADAYSTSSESTSGQSLSAQQPIQAQAVESGLAASNTHEDIGQAFAQLAAEAAAEELAENEIEGETSQAVTETEALETDSDRNH